MAETLSLRAARYFGVHDEPRTSVPLGDGAVAIVCERAGRTALMIYDEGKYGHRDGRLGTYSLLTPKQHADLVGALTRKER